MDNFKKETLLYGCKIGDKDYMEEVLYACKGYVNEKELMEKGEQWAKNNGYDRLRIKIIDLSASPDFTKTIN